MTEKEIFKYLLAQGLSKAGVAGIMGNMKAESGLKFNNLQDTYNKKLGMTDEQYTAAVDNGTYTNFVDDNAGYGCVQLTYWSRKKGFLDLCKARKVSISDPQAQLDYLMYELKSYKVLYKTLTTTTSVRTASDMVLTQFEKPADQSQVVKDKRYKYSQEIYDKYATESAVKSQNEDIIINTDYPCNKTNYGAKRTEKVTWIVVHYTGVKTDKAENNVKYFNRQPNIGASAHFFIDQYPTVFQSVPEDYVAWSVGKKYGNAKYWGIATNRNTINIELSSSNGQILPQTLSNAAKFIRYLMNKYGIDIDHVIRHKDVCAKNCPGWTISDDISWQKFKDSISKNVSITTSSNVPYKVRVTANNLTIRSGPGKNYIPVDMIQDKGVYTIVEEKGNWGRLKSGKGWICLDYTNKV